MGKEKEKDSRSCVECGASLGEKDVFHHTGMSYCHECLAAHVKSEHTKDTDSAHPLATPEGRRAWTYKTT